MDANIVEVDVFDVRNAIFVQNDPTLLATIDHLPNNRDIRKFYVGPANGSKGFRKWTEVPGGVIAENIGSNYPDCYRPHSAYVNWNATENAYNAANPTVALKYFNKLFPPRIWKSMVDGTNNNLVNRGYTKRTNIPLQKKFIGINLARVLERPRGSIDDLFRSCENDMPGVLQYGNYEKQFKMDLNTFKTLIDNIGLRVFEPEQSRQDRWFLVRETINEFNNHMPANFIPGKFLTVDEIMSAWKGLDLNCAANFNYFKQF